MSEDKRIVNSKGWLYLSLIDLLKQKSYNEITVSELTKHASIGRATFYRLYNNLDDLLLEEIHQEIKLFYEDMKNEDFYHLKEYIRHFLEYWNNNIELIEVLIQAGKMSLLYQAMDEVFLKDTPQIYELSFIIGGAIHALLTWVSLGRKHSIEDVISHISSKLQL